jgi:hypothetical protein
MFKFLSTACEMQDEYSAYHLGNSSTSTCILATTQISPRRFIAFVAPNPSPAIPIKWTWHNESSCQLPKEFFYYFSCSLNIIYPLEHFHLEAK